MTSADRANNVVFGAKSAPAPMRTRAGQTGTSRPVRKKSADKSHGPSFAPKLGTKISPTARSMIRLPLLLSPPPPVPSTMLPPNDCREAQSIPRAERWRANTLAPRETRFPSMYRRGSTSRVRLNCQARKRRIYRITAANCMIGGENPTQVTSQPSLDAGAGRDILRAALLGVVVSEAFSLMGDPPSGGLNNGDVVSLEIDDAGDQAFCAAGVKFANGVLGLYAYLVCDDSEVCFPEVRDEDVGAPHHVATHRPELPPSCDGITFPAS